MAFEQNEQLPRIFTVKLVKFRFFRDISICLLQQDCTHNSAHIEKNSAAKHPLELIWQGADSFNFFTSFEGEGGRIR
jgi:hypothetical protein